MSYENVRTWRRRTKENLVMAFGWQCVICGYSKCAQALDFHHINDDQKEFTITQSIRSLEALVTEVRKCALLCCRCHREVHYLGIELTSEHCTFNEQTLLERYRCISDGTPCEFCGVLKSVRKRFCSPRCSAMGRRRHAWTQEILMAALERWKYNLSAVGREFGVTDNAIRKQMRKLHVPMPP